MSRALVAIVLLAAAPAAAQTGPGTSRTGIPPNAADRALSASTTRDTDAARRRAADRVRADAAARSAAQARGSVAGSTMTDGLSGLGTRTDSTAPTSPPPR